MNPTIERKKRTEYYGAVSSLDREVGKVLNELKATGQMENTLIVYTGDHGLNCGQHGVWEKGNATIPQNFLEESIRMSCTVSWPVGGIRQNATVRQSGQPSATFGRLFWKSQAQLRMPGLPPISIHPGSRTCVNCRATKSRRGGKP